jgi:hypothetical protein
VQVQNRTLVLGLIHFDVCPHAFGEILVGINRERFRCELIIIELLFRTCTQAHIYMQALERNDMDAETTYTESGETTFKMSITSKPEDGEALTRFNAKADRKMLLKLDLLLVPMCCAM